MPSINKSRILIMATHGFEQSELVKPLEQLKAKGAKVEVAAPAAGQIKGWQDKNWGPPVDVDLTLDAVQVGDYDALVLPGGVMTPTSCAPTTRPSPSSKPSLNRVGSLPPSATRPGC